MTIPGSETPATALDERAAAASAGGTHGRGRRSSGSRVTILSAPRLALCLSIVVGILLRLQFAAAGSASLDADEAVTGLMARGIANGTENFIYFRGQPYNGSFEQYIQALSYAVLRLPQNPFTLRLTQVLLTAAVMVMIFLLSRLVFRGPWAPVLATAVYAVGPYWNVYLGTKSYGAYDTTQLVTLIAVYAALRATGFRRRRERLVDQDPHQTILWSGVFGLSVGLILWLGLSGLEIAVVAGLWILPTVIRSIRSIGAAVLGLLIGSSPVGLWMSHNRWEWPNAGGLQPATTLHQRFDLLVSRVAPEYLGTALGGGDGGWPRGLALAALALAGAVFVVAMAVRWRGVLAVLILRQSNRAPIDLILLTIPCAVIIYVISTHTWYFTTPRYLYMLYPMTAIATAGAVCWFAARWRARGVVSVVATLTVAALVFTGVSTSASIRTGAGTFGQTTDSEFVSANHYLATHGITKLYANYWTALPAEYFSDDSGVTTTAWQSSILKSGPARAVVDHSPDIAYMTSQRNLGTNEDKTLRTAFAAHRITYKTIHLGSITIYTDLSRPIRPSELGF